MDRRKDTDHSPQNGVEKPKKSSSLDIFLRFYHKKIQAKNEKKCKKRRFHRIFGYKNADQTAPPQPTTHLRQTLTYDRKNSLIRQF